jgi:hypothetical protein
VKREREMNVKPNQCWVVSNCIPLSKLIRHSFTLHNIGERDEQNILNLEMEVSCET